MFRSWYVPASVPSLRHSSPSSPNIELSATGNRKVFPSEEKLPPRGNHVNGPDTAVVPDSVPSLFHKPRPPPLSSGRTPPKYKLSPRTIMFVGASWLPPGNSFTSFVPAGVPSVSYSECDRPSRSARKYVLSLKRVNAKGEDSIEPGSRSATRVVPASVPSVRHSSLPVVASPATNSSVLPSANSFCGSDHCGPGLTSFTSAVPASVPSVFHSSRPTFRLNADK